MNQIGFPQQWISWVKRLVLPGSTQIILNSLVGRKTVLRRGVRQGDPLSPFLFIIAMDYIPRWLDRLTSMGALRMPVQGMYPSLFYADDALFFIKPEKQQIQILKIILLAYGTISGLRVNLEKSEIMAIVTDQGELRELARILGFKESRLPFTYLGLPLSDSKLPKTAFMPLIENIKKKTIRMESKTTDKCGESCVD